MFCTNCGEVLRSASHSEGTQLVVVNRDPLVPVTFGSSQSISVELSSIGQEIQTRLGIAIPATTRDRVELLLNRFRVKEGLQRYSNTEVAVRAGFIIELRQSYSFTIDKVVPNTGAQYKMVTRMITRMCKSLNLGLTALDQMDIIGQLYQSLSSHLPQCPPESSFRHDVMQLSSACIKSRYVSPTRSPTTLALACSYLVIKSRSSEVSLRQCIRAASLEQSEKACYRDHAQLKKFLEFAGRIIKTPDIRRIIDSIDQVADAFQIRDDIKNRIQYT